MLRIAWTWTGSVHDAQDICQTVLLKLLTSPRRFAEEGLERAWVVRVAVNCCKDWKKSAWVRRRLPLEAAAHAAVHLPEKLQGKRLLAAYNNDGPGFHADLLDTPAYRRVEDRLHTYIPESSIVGVLLVHAEETSYILITSHAAMEHEALSWQVMGIRFVHLGQRSQLGQMSDDVLREWLDSVSQEDREAFCDALYSILSMGGRAKTFEDLRKGGFSGWAALWKEYAGADERKKQILTEIFGRLAIDVKDELMKAAGQGLRSAGHGIRTVGQNLMGRREPDKTQTK